MKSRKKELAIVVAIVALAALFLRPAPEPVEEPAPSIKPPSVNVLMEVSEDTKWILETATDSYAPKVPVEKAWEEK